ncbi:MAG: zinc-dependent metalloprotease [Solirubrobacteraceae bacterium]
MVDWRIAERVADAVAGPAGGSGRPLAGDLDAMAERAVTRVTAYARLEPSEPLPPVEAVDRRTWSRANLATMRLTLDPVLEQLGSGPLQAAGGLLVGVEAGGIVGFMGRSVLGQYELSLLDPERPPRLLLVAPNLRVAAETFEADEAELLEWVVFHELTHAVQFTGVPWLRDHLAGMLRELLASIKVQVDPTALLRLPRADDLRGLWDAVREGGLVGAMAGPERKAVIDRLQATMAMIEGHAEHVMDAAGAPVLPSLPKLRASLEKRRREKPPLVKLIEKLLGMDLKMKQYEVGKRFCDAVVRDWGIEGLNRAWFAPELLPTLDELEDPAAWARRTQQRAVTP